jgi:hypothetical protein
MVVAPAICGDDPKLNSSSLALGVNCGNVLSCCTDRSSILFKQASMLKKLSKISWLGIGLDWRILVYSGSLFMYIGLTPQHLLEQGWQRRYVACFYVQPVKVRDFQE